MSVKDFQSFISTDRQLLNGSCVRNVSVTELGVASGAKGGHANKGPMMHGGRHHHQHRERVALVMDAENCLDRLYGGYFPNWVCGGQWRHMITFLANLFGRLHQSNVQVVVFLNGTLEPTR